MPREEVLNLLQKYVTPYRITKGKGFRLKDFDPGLPEGRRGEEERARGRGGGAVARALSRLASLQ